ncbi:MAG: c-type cytochrome [Alphaproteobacteria bacterium]|nr:c-type cytochrome [Alphaproteobacteria bacterium]
MHPGNAENGKRLFRACAGCHSLNPGETRVEPSLASLFGRKAGSMPRFRYSQALQASSIVRNERTLDAWLAKVALVLSSLGRKGRASTEGRYKFTHRARSRKQGHETSTL